MKGSSNLKYQSLYELIKSMFFAQHSLATKSTATQHGLLTTCRPTKGVTQHVLYLAVSKLVAIVNCYLAARGKRLSVLDEWDGKVRSLSLSPPLNQDDVIHDWTRKVNKHQTSTRVMPPTCAYICIGTALHFKLDSLISGVA